MPTYEYLCQSCSHRFETWQRMIDEPLTVCPECNGHIRRVLYPTGIIFKGPGFYKTDHGQGALPVSNGEAKKSENSTEKTGTAETGSATKSEGTSSAKSESKVPSPAAAD